MNPHLGSSDRALPPRTTRGIAQNLNGEKAGTVRKGEELDVASVDRWLKANVPGLSGSPSVTQACFRWLRRSGPCAPTRER
jgi:hypothetical protein